MENQNYRLTESSGEKLEFSVIDTKECNPYKEIREVEISFCDEKKEETFFSMNDNDIESLIKYLTDSLEYIRDFNKKSIPKETNE